MAILRIRAYVLSIGGGTPIPATFTADWHKAAPHPITVDAAVSTYDSDRDDWSGPAALLLSGDGYYDVTIDSPEHEAVIQTFKVENDQIKPWAVGTSPDSDGVYIAMLSALPDPEVRATEAIGNFYIEPSVPSTSEVPEFRASGPDRDRCTPPCGTYTCELDVYATGDYQVKAVLYNYQTQIKYVYHADPNSSFPVTFDEMQPL